MMDTWSPGSWIGKALASEPGSISSAPRGKARAAKLLSGLAAAALLAGTASSALAEQRCVREAERTAFDVRALQSQLMVVALVCERQDDYDAFVVRHRRALLDAYQDMTAHFHRLHGAAEGEDQRDMYITEMANAQSQAGTAQGRAFCRNMESFVQRATALRSTGDIARLSIAAHVATPFYPLASCAPTEVLAAPGGEGMAERRRDAGEARGVAAREEGQPPGLQARLERLERMLERVMERQPEAAVRPVAARQVARK